MTNKILTILLLSMLFISCSEDKTVSYDYQRTIVLLTDHEESSDFVITFKGMVSSEYPDTRIEFIKAKDLNIHEASYQLLLAAQYYPEGSVFVAEIDPGASSKKMVFSSGDKNFLVPDNGLASRVMAKMNTSNFYYVENTDILDGIDPETANFDEVFAAAANTLLRKIDLNKFGSSVESPVRFEIQDAKLDNGNVMGEFLYFDNFGNGSTNIPGNLMDGFEQGDLLKIQLGSNVCFATFGTSYSSVPYSQNVVFVNASDLLTIAVNYGSIEKRYNLTASDDITISKASAKIGILKYNDSEVVLDIMEHAKAQITSLGFDDNKISYIEKNANGDVSKFSGLCQELTDASVDLVLSVSTPASQAAINFLPEEIPLVFTYVTDPESAGILDIRTTTGLSDATNFQDYMNFVLKLLPETEILGTAYNDLEANASYGNSELKKIAAIHGITLFSEKVHSPDEFETAFNNLINNNSEAILIVADNTMSNNMEEFAAISWNGGSNLPVIGDSYVHCKDGALASISVNYGELGTETGNYLIAALRGRPLSEMEVKKFHTSVIAINKATAGKIGFTFPQEILDSAEYVYE